MKTKSFRTAGAPLLISFLLAAPAAVAAEEPTAAAAPATVSWGAAKTAAEPGRRTVDLEMSPVGTLPADDDTEGIHAAYYAGYLGSQALDFVSTKLALSNGAVEMNPLMSLAGAGGPGGLLVKAATSWGVIQLVKALSRRNPKAAAAALSVMTAMNAAAAVNNFANVGASR